MLARRLELVRTHEVHGERVHAIVHLLSQCSIDQPMSSHQALAFKGFTHQDDPPMGFAVGWNRMLMTLIHKFEVVRTQLVDQFRFDSDPQTHNVSLSAR